MYFDADLGSTDAESGRSYRRCRVHGVIWLVPQVAGFRGPPVQMEEIEKGRLLLKGIEEQAVCSRSVGCWRVP